MAFPPGGPPSRMYRGITSQQSSPHSEFLCMYPECVRTMHVAHGSKSLSLDPKGLTVEAEVVNRGYEMRTLWARAGSEGMRAWGVAEVDVQGVPEGI